MMEFDIDPLVLKSLEGKWRDEIERAIANVKRTREDKAFRREWYKAEARRRWDWMRRGRIPARGGWRGNEGEGSLARGLGVTGPGLGGIGVRTKTVSHIE